MKVIPETAAESKGARGVALRVAVLIEFTSGRYCYTSEGWNPRIPDCKNRQRVLSWGDVGALLESSDPAAFSQARFGVVVGDPDGELRDLFEDEQFQGRDCSVYWGLFTPGESPPTYQDSVKILRGTVVSPTEWVEGARSVSLEITDLSVFNEVLVGVRATRADFSLIDEDEEGRVVPTVYGYIDRIKPILLNRGPVTRVIRAFTPSDTSFVVADAEKFPQGVEITVEVGQELITGTFTGNLFDVKVPGGRGVNIFNSTTTGASSGSCTLIDTNIGVQTWADNRLVGYAIIMTIDTNPHSKFTYKHPFHSVMSARGRAFEVSWGPQETRRVIRVIKAQDKLEWHKPFVLEKDIVDDGAGNWAIEAVQVTVGAGVAYTIGTNADHHQSGDEVLRYLGANITLQYAVAMGTCAVRQVYVHGRIYKPRTIIAMGALSYVGSISTFAEDWTDTPDAMETQQKDDWIPLRPDLYTVDTITIDGKTVTRLNLVRYPRQLVDYVCTTDDILVDVTGPEDDAGNVIVNPAEVIEHIYASNSDVASKRGLVGWWKMDELDGSTVSDSSGENHDGGRYGETDWLPSGGKIDGALDFDGLSGEVRVPNDASLQAACAGQFSLAFWAKLDDLSLTSPIMTKLSASGAADGFELNIRPFNNIMRLWSSGLGDVAEGTIDITDNDWHHYVVVVDNTTVSMYVDGVTIAMTDPTIVAVPPTTAPLRIGYKVAGAVGYLNGTLDDVRIYDRALNAVEVAALATPAVGSFDCGDAQSNLTNWTMNFGREMLMPVREVVADLAMQARSRIRWIGDDPEMLYLAADGGDPDLEIAARNILQNSAAVGRDEIDLGASRVTATWEEDGEQRSLTEIDSAAEAEIGEREYSVDCWAYDAIEEPRALARFFLQTMKKLHDRARMAVTVHGVGLEPGDIVRVNPTQVENVIAEFDANLLTYAGDFDVAEAWDAAAVTVDPSATDPPAGLSRSDKLEEETTSEDISHRVSQSLSTWADTDTKLLLHCNGADGATDFTDASASGHAITAAGNAQVDTAQKVFGTSSGLFDGAVGTYVWAADHDDWNFGAGDFTIDFRVRFATVGTNFAFCGQDLAAFSWWFSWNVANQWLHFHRSGGAAINILANFAPVINTWYHIALVRNGNNWFIFVNGVDITTAGSPNALAMWDVAAPLTIGMEDGQAWLDGWLDEFRISKGIARWTANFTPPAAPYLVSGDGDIDIEAGRYYRFACRTRADERSQLSLILSEDGVSDELYGEFDVDSVATIATQGLSDSGIESLGDDWYLCWIEVLAAADGDFQVAAIAMMRGDAGSYAGVAGEGLYIAGAQFYTGRTIDEYMPTWERNGVRTNVSLVRANLTRNAHQNDKLLVGGDEYIISENGLSFVRVVGDVDGDGHSAGDVVALTDPTAYDPFIFAPTKARVHEVVHTPGTEPDVLAREDIELRVFRWAGCSTVCEGSCETTGCETSCESYYEPDDACWTCETSCQTACEHFCETGGELFCSDHECETALVVGCEIVCQVAEMAGGVPCGLCQTDCQSTCESDTCETAGLTSN